MNVILLTIFIGLVLVSMAIVFFFYTSSTSNGSSPERDSLLPLQDEITASVSDKRPMKSAKR